MEALSVKRERNDKMQKSRTAKVISLILAIIMLAGIFPASVLADSGNTVNSYDEFITDLTCLENYANEYVSEHPNEDTAALVINYVRSGVEKYTSGTWTTFCGPENTAFVNFVAQQDEANGTFAAKLRSLDKFTLPNGDEVEFAHMFGAMDMAYHTGNQKTADLGSWAGDICDLVQLTTNAGISGTVEEMAEEIRTKNDRYFLYDHPDPEVHSFGILDLYGDLDAFYILRKLSLNGSISSVMKNYFTKNLNDGLRAKFFLDNRFDGASQKDDIRDAVYETYCANEGVRTLEGTYLPNGVNPDIRKACCYAFADYLYETAKDLLSNSYYKVFSSKKSNIAPGVTQEIKYATSKDNKQLVYYLATADITRGDVSVHANYNDNNPAAGWKMSRVSDQVNAAQKRHSNPDDPDNYIENYNAVVGVNADFYDMSNGVSHGALIMEGVVYHDLGSENFFGILKDGTPIIGGRKEWNANSGNIQDAVGADVYLVKDGKIVPEAGNNYYSSRAPRTCVGITYDGQIVLMTLDGRQEPFSAGGSFVEIAQIMYDAGCVVAVNLDGGGSTTFAAKSEGAENVSVVNRPSDGYERSVSSSLLVVSTAKPSNVFDHAVVSADYDYLTIGTELDIDVRGVTATGGAISIPEGATLKISDESIGTISAGGTFTAKNLGDVKIQLVAQDGTVLGSKTLHVVEPTDLKFKRESVNAIFGKAEELPLEASYNGNVVKINPGDVQFGFVKITLVSIGQVEGGSVNTTKTELVFDYPEAGTVNGFNFTPKEDSTLRTLTIGAVLKSKLPEFQNAINSEYARVYQEALSKGYTKEEAAIQAQTAGINKALSIAAKLTVYLYSEDEASFDFSEATGGSALVAWKRNVSNSYYNETENAYYAIDSNAQSEISYTFAVDMSKVSIPEKLTGLLYMLPGGDQEGRTAWDFLLQLAERISPLTTVSISITVPEGFTVDTSKLRLANEYFTLTSAKVEGNKLTIVCNFKEQSEPINPTTANPLCVLTGLKFIPKDGAAWSEDGKLDFTLNGQLDYDIYAHFHVLKTLAQQEEYQQKYGLYPYDNSANINGDYGAHFMDTADSFSDKFVFVKKSKDGWSRENGLWLFYRNGKALTGIQKLPSHIDGEEGEFWYDLGTQGSCSDKLTGLFEYEGEHYYARFGELVSGWQSIEASDGESYFYYFDPVDYTMYTGVRTIKGLTYTFNDEGVMVRGAFRTDERGTKYFVAGESVYRRFVTLEEGTYWLDVNGYVAYGNDHTVTTNVKDVTWYHFDEKTGLMTGLCNGFIDYHGELYYCDENGKVFYGLIKTDGGIIFTATLGKVNVNMGCYVDSSTATRGCKLETGKYWCGDDGFIVANGFADIDGETYYFENYNHAKGFKKIGDDYYIFNAGTGRMYKDANMWVGDNPYGIEGGIHYFGKDGKMFVPDLENGEKKIVSENGKLYFTVDGTKVSEGLYELDGDYYYVQGNKELAVNKDIYVTTKLLDGTGWYRFDGEGKLIKNGFADCGGYTFYFTNGIRAKGFTKIGDDYYIFNTYSGKMYKDANMWVGDNPYGIEGGIHYFGKDGKMFVPDLENGEKKIVSENGKLYFTVDGTKVSEGLYELDGDYYYVQGNKELAVNKDIYVTTKLLDGTGWYRFDGEGKLIKNGFADCGGYTFYFTNGIRAKGFTKIGDDYYIFNTYSGKMYKDANMWVGDNPYGIEGGIHYFGKDGKMFVPDLENGEKKIVSENGKLYFTVDGTKVSEGLYELDGDYYYVQANKEIATDKAFYLYNSELKGGVGWYRFGGDGKLITDGFVECDGKTFYFSAGERAKGFTKIGDDYYIFNTYSGMMYKDADMWVGDNPYGIAGGMHYFGKDGKMAG